MLATLGLMLMACAVPGDSEDGAHEVAQRLLRPLKDVATLALGEQLDFRYRRLEFSEPDGASAPRRVLEGVVRVEFEEHGVAMHDAYFEGRAADGPLAEAFLERTFYSYLSGESARSIRIAGGATENVVIERSSGIDKIVYLGLGLLGASGALADAKLIDVQPAEGGLIELEYLVESGKSILLTIDAAPPGRLVHAESRSNDEAWAEVLDFEGHVEGGAGLPLRPTRIVNARVRRDGHVQTVTVWQSIERLDQPMPDARNVSQRTWVADLRVSDSLRTNQWIDRAMNLADMAAAPAGIAQPHDLAAVKVERAALEALFDSKPQSRAAAVPTLVAVIVLTVGAAALRKGKQS